MRVALADSGAPVADEAVDATGGGEAVGGVAAGGDAPDGDAAGGRRPVWW